MAGGAADCSYWERVLAKAGRIISFKIQGSAWMWGSDGLWKSLAHFSLVWAGRKVLMYEIYRSGRSLLQQRSITFKLQVSAWMWGGDGLGRQSPLSDSLLPGFSWQGSFTMWAPSSEFVSSSIPSWQILTGHAQPFRGTRDLALCLKVPLESLLVWASSKGSGETAWMHRLAWTFAARIGDKYQIRLTRSM